MFLIASSRKDASKCSQQNYFLPAHFLPFKNLSSHYVVEVNEQCKSGSTPFSIMMTVSLTVNRVDIGGME